MKTQFTCALVFALALSVNLSAAEAPSIQNIHPQAVSETMGAPQTVVVDALPQKAGPATLATGRFANLRPQNGISDVQFATLKKLAGQQRITAPEAYSPRPALDASSVTSDSPVLGTNFDGINANCSFVIPSDMGIAVSSTWVVQVVNDCFAVYTKSGGLQAGYPKDLNSFFGVPPNNFSTGQIVTDPRLFYDALAGRFVMVALWEDLPDSTGYIMVATSVTSDPRGAWRIYFNVPGTGICPDFPTLGHNRYGDKFVGVVSVGINLFTCSPSGFGGFSDQRVYFFPKNDLYKGLPVTYWYYYGFGGLDTPVPASVDDKNDGSRSVIVLQTYNGNYGGGSCVNGCSGLIVWSFTNVVSPFNVPGPGPDVSVVQLPTSTYTLPPNADQPGGPNTIDTNDVRISGSVPYLQNRLYATINTNNGAGGSGILAWQLHVDLDDNGDGHCTGAFLNACPRISSAAIDNEMNYDVNPSGGTTNNAFFGTIHPDSAGNITMVFSFSGDFNYPGTAYTSQRISFAPSPNFHDGGHVLRNGVAYYPYGRWGDYTGTAVDGDLVWFSGMYSRSDGLWNTGIGKAGYSSTNQP